MQTSPATAQAMMPDIAGQALAQPQGELSWVGMNRIHMPLRILGCGVEHPVTATVDTYVDLVDAHARGVHMSRLYLLLRDHTQQHPLTPMSLKSLLSAMLNTHQDMSASARVHLKLELCLQRPPLKSDNVGFNSYPITVDAVLENGAFSFELGVDVLYSSTCPCGAVLARQLIQTSFDRSFASAGELDFDDVRAWLGTQQAIVATPHSQRSVAEIRVKLAGDSGAFPFLPLIDSLEETLATPVQTAVKREDEQVFALRNGQNLMFCEDAARKLKGLLEEADYPDYRVRIEHQERLHAHDAVAIVVKGVEGGFRRGQV